MKRKEKHIKKCRKCNSIVSEFFGRLSCKKCSWEMDYINGNASINEINKFIKCSCGKLITLENKKEEEDE